MLNFIKHEIKPDIVLWGGDSVPHNIDSQDDIDNYNIVKNITNIVRNILDDVRIFPAIGNHDTYPQDEIKMGYPKSNKNINEWDNSWNQFMTSEE